MPCTTDRKWIVDSGSCFDIVGAQYMDAKERREQTTTQRPYRIITANGVLRANRETTIPVARTGSQTNAIVLKDSPCVLSLGKRCMKEGFAFEWKPGENPVLISPDGKRTTLELQNMVPVLPVVDKEPRETEATTTTGDTTTSGTSSSSKTTSTSSSSASSSGAGGNPDTGGPKANDDHMLTHFPKLSTCEICAKSKTQRATCRRTSSSKRGGGRQIGRRGR